MDLFPVLVDFQALKVGFKLFRRGMRLVTVHCNSTSFLYLTQGSLKMTDLPHMTMSRSI